MLEKARFFAAVVLVAGFWPMPTVEAQTATDTRSSTKVGINDLFLEPSSVERRQIEHNHFFLHSPADAESKGTILDLQTSEYAAAERPVGLSYDVYSAIGFGLATSMMVVGPERDSEGYRRLVIIDTLENTPTSTGLAQSFLTLYNQKYLDRPGQEPLAAKKKLPIDVIIFSHNHVDHTGGVAGFLSMADKPACPAQDPSDRGFNGDYRPRDCLEIIGQEKIVDAVANTAFGAGRIIQARSFYMFGLALANELAPPLLFMKLPYGEGFTNGIGPYLSRAVTGFRLPSRTFAESMRLKAAGLEVRLMHLPSETEDEAVIFVPDAANGADPAVDRGPADRERPDSTGWGSGLLFSAEVIQGPAFPNLYSLRGTAYRSPATWYAAVDKLRELDAWCMVPSHGPPICRRQNVRLLLRNFRDAVQFTHDQTLRYMNMGYGPEALVDKIQVPEALAEELTEQLQPWPNASGRQIASEDYLLPLYGSMSQSVRAIYSGYLGWFDGDPVNLAPTEPSWSAKRMAALIAGDKSLADAAEQALKQGELQWAAELATLWINAEPESRRAREVKSEAFRALGERAVNPNWRHWYYTSAAELMIVDHRPQACFLPYLPVGLVSPAIQTAAPLDSWVRSWTWKVQGEKAKHQTGDKVFGFWFEPRHQDFGAAGYLLRLRHGIVEVIPWSKSQEDFLQWAESAVQISEGELDSLILRQAGCLANRLRPGASGDCPTFSQLLSTAKVQWLRGNADQAEEFFSYFDTLPSCQPPVTVPRPEQLEPES